MDDYIKRILAHAEIAGIIAEHEDIRDDIDAVRDVERAVTSLKDRCVRAARLGVQIGLRSNDGVVVQGVCADVGEGFVVVSDGASVRQAVPFAHVVEVQGLPDALADESVKPVQYRGSFRSLLRGIEGPCRIHRVDGSYLAGVIEVVGNDHLEVTSPDGHRYVVPLTAVTSAWWTQ